MNAASELMKSRRKSAAGWMATAAKVRAAGARLAKIAGCEDIAASYYRDARLYLGWARVDLQRNAEDGARLP